MSAKAISEDQDPQTPYSWRRWNFRKPNSEFHRGGSATLSADGPGGTQEPWVFNHCGNFEFTLRGGWLCITIANAEQTITYTRNPDRDPAPDGSCDQIPDGDVSTGTTFVFGSGDRLTCSAWVTMELTSIDPTSDASMEVEDNYSELNIDASCGGGCWGGGRIFDDITCPTSME